MAKKLHSLRSLHFRRKELRENQTPEEERLWWYLKGKRLGGYKFRRQHSIGGYIVDFYCAEKRLIVEVDGGIHQKSDNKEYDNIRDKYFTELDYSVLRFLNDQIENDIQNVLTKIKSYL